MNREVHSALTKIVAGEDENPTNVVRSAISVLRFYGESSDQLDALERLSLFFEERGDRKTARLLTSLQLSLAKQTRTSMTAPPSILLVAGCAVVALLTLSITVTYFSHMIADLDPTVRTGVTETLAVSQAIGGTLGAVSAVFGALTLAGMLYTVLLQQRSAESQRQALLNAQQQAERAASANVAQARVAREAARLQALAGLTSFLTVEAERDKSVRAGEAAGRLEACNRLVADYLASIRPDASEARTRAFKAQVSRTAQASLESLRNLDAGKQSVAHWTGTVREQMWKLASLCGSASVLGGSTTELDSLRDDLIKVEALLNDPTAEKNAIHALTELLSSRANAE